MSAQSSSSSSSSSTSTSSTSSGKTTHLISETNGTRHTSRLIGDKPENPRYPPN